MYIILHFTTLFYFQCLTYLTSVIEDSHKGLEELLTNFDENIEKNNVRKEQKPGE